jgi:hypothetical protein
MLLASATLSERDSGMSLIERSRNERGDGTLLASASLSELGMQCRSLSGVEMSGVEMSILIYIMRFILAFRKLM